MLDGCLGPCGLLNKNTTDWVAEKQQDLACHSAGGWKPQIRKPAWSSEGCRRVAVPPKGALIPKAPPPKTSASGRRALNAEGGRQGSVHPGRPGATTCASVSSSATRSWCGHPPLIPGPPPRNQPDPAKRAPSLGGLLVGSAGGGRWRRRRLLAPAPPAEPPTRPGRCRGASLRERGRPLPRRGCVSAPRGRGGGVAPTPPRVPPPWGGGCVLELPLALCLGFACPSSRFRADRFPTSERAFLSDALCPNYCSDRTLGTDPEGHANPPGSIQAAGPCKGLLRDAGAQRLLCQCPPCPSGKGPSSRSVHLLARRQDVSLVKTVPSPQALGLALRMRHPFLIFLNNLGGFFSNNHHQEWLSEFRQPLSGAAKASTSNSANIHTRQ